MDLSGAVLTGSAVGRYVQGACEMDGARGLCLAGDVSVGGLACSVGGSGRGGSGVCAQTVETFRGTSLWRAHSRAGGHFPRPNQKHGAL